MKLGKKELSMNGFRYMILLGIIVVLLVVFSIVSDQFLKPSTMMNVVRQSATVSIGAIGMTMVILTGGIDLSAGSILAFSGVCGALVMQSMNAAGQTGAAVAVAGILMTLLSACAVGVVNGVLVGVGDVSPFMATLAIQYAAHGLALKFSGGSRVNIKEPLYTYFGQQALFKAGSTKVPASIILVVLCYLIAYYILYKTAFGRKTYAVGGNRVAAKAAGIHVTRHIVLIYAFAALTYALGSIVTAGRASSAHPLAGEGQEFEFITAVVIGGTALAGGSGTLIGTFLGVVMIGIITTGLGMIDVQPYVNYAVKGVLILLAVSLDQVIRYMGARNFKKGETPEEVQPTDNSKALERIHRNEQSVMCLHNITKTFPGVKALDNVSIEIKRGKVHALMGENGAGKSTLMKVLSGVYQKDGGFISVDGIPVDIRSPLDSTRLGIAVIYQELEFVPELNLAQNIFMGKELTGSSKIFLDLKKMRGRAAELMQRFGMNVDVTQPSKSYTVGQLQMVEIAKAIDSNAWLVVMDEPTGAITEADKEKLFGLIRELKEKGVAIVYISHRLSEIFEIADEVTVLRDGQFAGHMDIEEVTEAKLIKSMVGRELNSIFDREKTVSDDNDVVLEVKNLYRKGVFEPISFKVHAGEVLGFSGLIGAGRTEIMRCIFGLDKADGGEIYLNGERVNIHNVMSAIRLGIGYVSEDRRREGIVPLMSVKHNISLPSLPWITRLGKIDNKQDLAMCNEYVDKLSIKTPSIEQLIGNLSGGNQQKVCLSKWLARNPKLIILDEPTRGIDVGAKAEIHTLIHSLTEQNIAVIMISSELPEIIGASDRIIVLYEGQMMAEFDSRYDAITQETLMRAASGVRKEA